VLPDSNCWAIFGGGFGLYGYLPALIKSGARKVLVLERHRSSAEARPELNQYLPCVQWLASKQEILEAADSLVIAVPPYVQESVIRSLSGHCIFQYLVIEKPIAHSPACAKEIFVLAREVAVSVRVGYSFLYTEWNEQFMRRYIMYPGHNYSILWQFMAHHQHTNQSTWKTRHESGGGALRFYGIHVLALLAQICDVRVVSSQLHEDEKGRAVRWVAQLRNEQGGVISIDVNCSCAFTKFCILQSDPYGGCLIDLPTPFSTSTQRAVEDVRIPHLLRLLATLNQPSATYYNVYSRADILWQEVEDSTDMVPSTTTLL
jgi:predicted dehydrogenase